jgi:hypothetical protein
MKKLNKTNEKEVDTYHPSLSIVTILDRSLLIIVAGYSPVNWDILFSVRLETLHIE